MNEVHLNFVAILLAALSMFLIGGVWYSKNLFGKLWLRELGQDESFFKTGKPVVIFGGSFLLALIMAFNLAGFVSGYDSWEWGLLGGLLAGMGWVAMSLGIIYLFERRSLKLFFINAGYIVVSFLVMGLIIGTWK